MTPSPEHRTSPAAPVTWRKSSRSPSQGANCIEVGAWRKSRRSADGTGQCIEAGACACHGVAIRDTKHHASGTLSVSAAEWSSLLAVLRDG
ncbi:DUF397 domain-containing protein [Stackebrandtia endophytica]|uniref:DUF397 domain-containing protein n=1 Tax=Stackebrandtia endophytica TaxID=1496996 RepID=UPI00114F03CB